MVWPIIGVKSYVGEKGKSMKAGDLTAPQKVIDEISPFHQNRVVGPWCERLLKNTFRGISRTKFARKLLNLRLP
jgi:hypothetical protein